MSEQISLSLVGFCALVNFVHQLARSRCRVHRGRVFSQIPVVPRNGLEEVVCVENNGDILNEGLEPIPTGDMADF